MAFQQNNDRTVGLAPGLTPTSVAQPAAPILSGQPYQGGGIPGWVGLPGLPGAQQFDPWAAIRPILTKMFGPQWQTMLTGRPAQVVPTAQTATLAGPPGLQQLANASTPVQSVTPGSPNGPPAVVPAGPIRNPWEVQAAPQGQRWDANLNRNVFIGGPEDTTVVRGVAANPVAPAAVPTLSGQNFGAENRTYGIYGNPQARMEQ